MHFRELFRPIDDCQWLLNEEEEELIKAEKANSALSALPTLESLEYMSTTEPPGWPKTVEQLQNECADHFHQRPCQWQSEIAFKLVKGKMLVSISATGSGKSYVFWLPMYYESGLTIIIVPLKNLGQQLTDESSQRGFWGVSMTAKILGESPNLLKVRHVLSNLCQN